MEVNNIEYSWHRSVTIDAPTGEAIQYSYGIPTSEPHSSDTDVKKAWRCVMCNARLNRNDTNVCTECLAKVFDDG